MKTLNFLVVLSILFGLGLNGIKAQEPQKISYQKISGITSILIINLDTTQLAILTLKPDMATSKHNNQSLKKIKPYISNKTSFFDTGLYKFIATFGKALLSLRGNYSYN